jgi:putative redox protein
LRFFRKSPCLRNGHPRALRRSKSEEAFLEITLQHTGGARFLAEGRQHQVVVDQPAQDGATDHGLTPSELLLVALGSCIGQYAAQYLAMRGLPAKGLLVRVQAERASKPLRLADFQVEIIAPGLTERQLRALEKSFPAGIVANSLSRENRVQIRATSMHAGDIAP